jgi:hypothetical protein
LPASPPAFAAASSRALRTFAFEGHASRSEYADVACACQQSACESAGACMVARRVSVGVPRCILRLRTHVECEAETESCGHQAARHDHRHACTAAASADEQGTTS